MLSLVKFIVPIYAIGRDNGLRILTDARRIMERIFKTEYFFERLEAMARGNMKRELDQS
jgi:predicted metal-dependent HD superfamily phosphohydrolase